MTRFTFVLSLLASCLVTTIAFSRHAAADVLFWSGGANGTFQNSANWGGQVPGPNNFAVFVKNFAGANNVTVGFTGSVTNVGLDVGNLAVTFNLAQHTYTVTGILNVVVDSHLRLNNGTLSVGIANIDTGSLLTVSDDATFISNTAILGGPAGSTGQANIAGIWNSNVSIIVGNTGTGELNISHDGNASTGTGGEVTTQTLLIGGASNGQGTINIGEGGLLRSNTASLGVGNGSTAAVNIGDGGRWINTNAITLGALAGTAGSGTITVEDGGLLRSVNLSIGNNGNLTQLGSGAVVIGDTGINFNGLNSTIQNRINAGGLFVANSGLRLLNGGILEATDAYIDSFTANAIGTALVTGNGSLLDVGDDLIVGAFRAGSLTIADGGRVESGDGIIGERQNASGSVTVTGQSGSTASQWNVDGALTIGQQGQGELTIVGGGIVNTTGNATVGSTPSGSGTVLVSGTADPGDPGSDASTFNIGGNLTLGVNLMNGAASSQNQVNGSLLVNNGGRVIVGGGAGTIIVNETGLLSGTGTVSGNVQLFGRLSSGDPAGAIIIDGNLATFSGSIIQVQYSNEPLDIAATFPNLDPSLVNALLTSGFVAVEGFATLADGTAVNVVKLSGNATPGDVIIILQADMGGMNPAAPPQLEVAGSFLVQWIPEVIESNGSQYLLITAEIDEPGLEDFLTGLTGNARNIADALAAGELFDVLTMLDPNNPEAGLRTLMPLQHASTAFQNIRASQHFNNAFLQEMAGLRTSIRSGTRFGPNAPRMFGSAGTDTAALADAWRSLDLAHQPLSLGLFEQRAGVWGGFVGGMASWDRVDSGANRAGYRADVAGVQGGIHVHLSRDLLVGVAASYLWTDLDFRENLGEGEIDTMRGGAYLSWMPGGGDLFVDGAFTYGYHRNEMDRETIMGTARSRYDAQDLSALAHVGYDFEVYEGLLITPQLGGEYSHLRTDSFRERGAGNANLAVSSMSHDSMRVRVGSKVSYALQYRDTTFIPELYAGWSYELLDNDIDLRSSFIAGGPAFTTRTSGIGRDSIDVSAGFTATAGTYFTLYVRYEGAFQSNRTSHGIVGGLDIRF